MIDMAKIFNPLADRIIKEIEADKGKKIKRIKPGQKFPLGKMCVFQYDPKHKGTLPYYDTFPASICIAHYPNGELCIASHYLNWALRLNLVKRLLRATKNKNRITYKHILKAMKSLNLPISYGGFIIKRYLYSHITSREVYIFDFEDYHKFLMDVPPKFQKKSDKIVYSLTIKAYNDYAKKAKSINKKLKTTFTNKKR